MLFACFPVSRSGATDFIMQAPAIPESERQITSSREALYKYMQTVGEQYQVPPLLLLAIAEQESRLFPWAVNIAGKAYYPQTKILALELLQEAGTVSFDIGIMQINKQWLEKFGLSVDHVIEPHINIIVAAYILNENFIAHGPTWKALAAYHTGRVDSDRAVNYAKDVWARYFRLSEQERKKAELSQDMR